MSTVFYSFSAVPNFAPIKKKGTASALHALILENFWTKVGLKV